MEHVSCPSCGQQRFRKVMAIIDAETSTATIPVERTWDWWRDNPRQRYETTRDVTTRSALAEKLLPPASITTRMKEVEAPEVLETRELQARQTPGLGIGVWTGALMALLFGCLTLAVFSGSTSTAANSAAICLYPILMVIGVAITVFFDRRRKNTVVDTSRVPDDIKAKVTAQRQRYQAYQAHERNQMLAIERYQRLYYCEVCGSVFDPQDPRRRAFAAGNMEQYLWAN